MTLLVAIPTVLTGVLVACSLVGMACWAMLR